MLKRSIQSGFAFFARFGHSYQINIWFLHIFFLSEWILFWCKKLRACLCVCSCYESETSNDREKHCKYQLLDFITSVDLRSCLADIFRFSRILILKRRKRIWILCSKHFSICSRTDKLQFYDLIFGLNKWNS